MGFIPLIQHIRDSITVYEKTLFSGSFSGLFPRRRLGEESAECVAFMNVLFPGWPTKTAGIPNDVDVECIEVTIASHQAILKWDMISSNQTAMEQIETFVAEKVEESIEITISGQNITVTVESTSRTGKEDISEGSTESPVSSRTKEVSLGGDSESEPSEKGWLVENWLMLLVGGLGLIIIIVVVFYWCLRKAATSAPEGNVRVWVEENDKKGTVVGREEKARLMSDKKSRMRRKKEKEKEKKEITKMLKAVEKRAKAKAKKEAEKKAKAKKRKKSKRTKSAKK